MTTIFVERPLSATHQIEIAGELEAVHGHDFSCRVELLVDDHRDAMHLAAELEKVLAPLSHTDLDRVRSAEEGHPSAERIARHIHRQLEASLTDDVRLIAVGVREAPGCTATYRSTSATG